MSAHNSFKRRLRRRFRNHLYAYIVLWLYGAAVTTSMVLWEMPGQHFLLLGTVARWVWILLNVVFCVPLTFAFLLSGVLPAALGMPSPFGKEYVRTTLLGGSYFLFALLASLIALIYGCIDLAVYLFFAPIAVGTLGWAVYRRDWRTLWSVFFFGFVIASVPLKSVGLALFGLWGGFISPLKSNLRARLRYKSSPSEYLEQQRQYAAHMKATSSKLHPNKPFTGVLRVLCELEMWQEAERELSESQAVTRLEPDEEKIWRAKIDLGLGRFAAVVKSADPREGHDSAEFKATLAVACAKLGRPEKARQIVQDLASGKRRHAEWIGDIQFALGDDEAALDYYEQAARGRRDYRILSDLARVLAALGNDREAAVFFREAVLAAQYVRRRGLRELAACYRHLGKERAAKEVEEIAYSVR